MDRKVWVDESRVGDSRVKMLEGTLSVYAFIIIFPIAVLAGLLFLIRSSNKATEWYEGDERLDGKTVLITGGSSGLGRALSVELAKRGARVIVACRTKARKDSTAFFLRSRTGSFNVRVMYLDMSSLDSVWEFAKELSDTEERLDLIVNNAGRLCPRAWTADGYDLMMGVNYLSHFYLFNLLLEKLRETALDSPVRIINILCGSFRSGKIANIDDMECKSGPYDMRQIYKNSKLALHLFNKEISQRYRNQNIVSFGVDPGPVASGLHKNLPGVIGKLWRGAAQVLFRTTEEGIQTMLYTILSKDIECFTGKIFRDCRFQDVRNSEWTDKVITSLWDKSVEAIESKGLSFSLKDEDEE
ncbi:retinol dehydrogenase 12-like [Centruroides sculpturatus]|uniref:retinol dehydrogenase 12-like n=1 Tax=Centruroides sculpturatus TaxID=218467 RepID=UPI000C6DD42E|nr:retinol dehydrogenase 12-like [Centruroides sculpturatus]